MARKYFGTDGIRGTANTGHMTAETALRVGMAAGRVFRRGEHRHRVVIGKDTRLSGYMLEPALTAGFTSMGMDVFLFGPLPTPAVAMLTRSLRADLGVMISASHNSFEDNGIKLFGPDGFKLSDEVELAIEHHMDNGLADNLAGSRALGRAKRIEDAQARYIEHVKHSFPKQQTLEGLRIVVDCANGAAYKVAPAVLWELGAEVVTVGTDPNGFNINEECGSTSPDRMCATVRERRADIGIALDGDADRVIIADERGATRASHPLPRRIRPECKPARAGDAIGARQAACERCSAGGRKRPRRAAQPRAEAPCDELGATAQAGLFHRHHHLRPLRRRGADRRQHRGTHRHPRHPRPLREARRAGASALPARSAR
ncbi:hypothetical protein ACMGOI_006390, partial [Pseudomonas aeruginosa]